MKLSLCCISNILAEQGLKFRTMTYKTYSTMPRADALAKLSKIIHNNFHVTRKIIQFCDEQGIKGYRLSSDLTPVLNHPDVLMKMEDLPDFGFIQHEINNIKRYLATSDIKISAHPSEYITLTTDDPKAIANSILDLETHADIFNRIGLPEDYSAPLNIHCRKDGDPEIISGKFMNTFEKLSDSVRNRLVIEVNDNVSGVWSVKNLVKHFYEKHNIPITFDTLHHKFLHGDLCDKDAFELAYATWNTTPVFHYSEGIGDTRNHASMATGIPESYGYDVVWDVELKNKDYAILDIMNRAKVAV
jgi:UV DNA damage endonuclease